MTWCSIHLCVCLINNSETAKEMRGVLGMVRVIDAPYGENPRVFRPHEDVEEVFDIALAVGAGDPAPTVVMLEELEKDTPDISRIRHDLAERLLPEVMGLADRFTRAGYERTVRDHTWAVRSG